MYDFLVDNAIKNVWCTPDQDKQSIIEPAKLTGKDGDLNTTIVLNKQISLPVKNIRFHIFQIGGIYLRTLGFPEVFNQWNTLASACNSSKLIIDIYANSGIQLPRVHVWYMCTVDGNIILAVRAQPTINIDLNNDAIYMRVYSNAYFASSESDPLNDYVMVTGGDVLTINDIINLQIQFNNAQSLNGGTYAFVNGIKVSNIDLLSTNPGDVAEFVYDSSISKIIDIPISDMETFISTLDNKNKYLVHYPDITDGTIDYLDDIDFFIIQPTINNKHIGVYYHKNMADAVRMVTHKDYSVVVPYLVGYLNSISSWTDVTKLTLRLHIRKSGYDRKLIEESNRILDLYKLPDQNVVEAMVGVNSTVPNWKAANLENSGYTKLMGSTYAGVTRDLVQNAYGYDLISTIIGNTPNLIDTTTGVAIAEVPYGLINNSIAYEYDVNGLLLGWYIHTFGTEYIANNDNCYQVELIAGIADENYALDEYYGPGVYTLDPTLDYRFYICPIINGIESNEWTDVTGSNSYQNVNNVITWSVDPTQFYTLIRSNKNILAYDLSNLASEGLLNFSLFSTQTRNGNTSKYLMQIPMGELTVFLNGNSLIENIDYIFNFPEVVIITDKYNNDILRTPQVISVRYTGFCNSDISSAVVQDVGYINHQLLSYNNIFNIRDTKVSRVVIGGKFYNQSQLKFTESDIAIDGTNVSNGLPYSIKDIVVPFRGLGATDTYTARSLSVITDNYISEYLTAFNPQIDVNTPNVINSLYPLYSPFICKIIYDVISGVIDNTLFDSQRPTDQLVSAVCRPYLQLLKFDPTQVKDTVDLNYVFIKPHNLPNVISLNVLQYTFINKVINLYMNGLVSLNSYVSISQ